MQSRTGSKKSIFQQEFQKQGQNDISNEIEIESNHKDLTQLKQQLRKILYKKQNIYLRENLVNLRKRRLLEGFAEDLSPTVYQALANARSLKILDISGMDIHPLLAIEIGRGLKHNTSLRELHMGSCKMNSFSLQYIFSSLTNHKNLQLLNIFNNQGFTIDLVNDLNQFLFQGKNNLKKLKLTHCNISTTGLSYLFRNIKSSKSIRQLDVSMMYFNTEVLTSLGIALEEYKGKEVLESLNISDCSIRDSGLQTLTQRLSWNIRKINIQELILRSNQITQAGVQYLESLLKEINQLKKLDLSYNKIEEFNCLELHSRKMYEVHLVKNCISTFSNYFFMNTLVVNLSNNNISIQGAFQLSSILRQNPLWIELNLTSNCIQSEGFNSIIFGLRDNTMLKKLIVANNQLDGESIICYMINHEQVQFEYLDVSLNQIRFQLIVTLLNFITSGSLRSLRCSYILEDDESQNSDLNIFSDDELNFQQGSQTFQLSSLNLVELDLQGNKNIFTAIISSLTSYFNKIEKLNLSGCSPIYDQDIDQLCQFLRKSGTIRELDLSYLNIGSLKAPTMKSLSDAISLSCLKILKLRNTKLYKNINKLHNYHNELTNFKLEAIDLSYNCLEGRHLNYIQKLLIKFRNLQEIDLSHNFLNFECINAINKVLQNNESIKRLNLSSQKLCADDLLILSSTISTEGLQELNLSNNLYTSKTKTYFQQCSQKKQNYLKFEHIFFDETYFLSLLTIIKQQKRTLKGITLEACFFKSGQYLEFVRLLHNCKNIEYFEYIYNPTLDSELSILSNNIPDFGNINVLKFIQIPIPRTFISGLSEFLTYQQCQLLSIDFSWQIFEQEQFDIICKGLQLNTSLKELILNNCLLGFLDLTSLGRMISRNRSILKIELARNQLTNLNHFVQGFKEDPQVRYLEKLDFSDNPFEEQGLIEFNQVNQQKTLFQIQNIDFSGCQVNNSVLEYAFQSFQSDQFKENDAWKYLNYLSLLNNQLNSHSGLRLKYLIIGSPNLLELSLSKNQLASQGALEVLRGILQQQNLITLDLSNNLINDSFINMIAPELLSNQLKSLKFILLRNNHFTAYAQKKLVEIIKFQKKLFIDYIWSKLDDVEAEQILIQYTKVGSTYHLRQELMPNFLKEIQIYNAQLTDKFCELLAKHYPLLSFIEFIDLSDNPNITMYGKVYLFIHIFDQSFDKHSLKALYIGDTQETRKLYDDGLFRYLLLKFRNSINPHTNRKQLRANSHSQIIGQKSIISMMLGEFCGSWILHKINKLMVYLDKIEPPQFIVSTLFIGKFRKNNIQIKTIVIILTIFSLSTGFFQFYRLIFKSDHTYDEIHQLTFEQCNFNGYATCNNQQLFGSEKFSILAQIIYVIITNLFQLGMCIFLRKKIKPAFQIIHPKVLKYYQSSLPHTQEIVNMIFSMTWTLSSLPERFLLYYLAILRTSDLRGEYYSFKTMYYLILVLVSLRFHKYLVTMFYTTFIFLKMKPMDDLAKFLQQLQKCMHYQGYFVISETLVALCPLQGVSLTKSIIVNEEVLVSAMTILFIESFTLGGFILLYREYSTFIQNTYNGFDPLGMSYVWIIMVLIKTILSIIVMLFRILTVRPAVVKQHGFNQGLTLKRFAENRKLFVPPSHMKMELQDIALDNQIIEESTGQIVAEQCKLVLNKDNQMEDIMEEDDIEEGVEEIYNLEKNTKFTYGSINDEQQHLE